MRGKEFAKLIVYLMSMHVCVYVDSSMSSNHRLNYTLCFVMWVNNTQFKLSCSLLGCVKAFDSYS